MNNEDSTLQHSSSQFHSIHEEYSDLLNQSTPSFLNHHQSITINQDHPIDAESNQQTRNEGSALIDLNSINIPFNSIQTTHPSNPIHPINLMDHSISSFDRFLTHQSNPPVSYHTPPHSPPPIINNILSTPAAIAAMSPLSSPLTTLTRTRSTDFLHSRNTPTKSTTSLFPRSKSSNAIRSSLSHHSEQLDSEPSNDPIPPIIKSILRRPNSPSKGSRARFFSPRVLVQVDDQIGNQSDLVDDLGHFRAREVVHEFEVDAPPNSSHSSRPEPHSPRHQTIPSSATTIRRQHIPRFTIPEPAELDIEPILPRLSTSPSPSPPSLQPTIFPNRSRTGTSKADGSTSILDCSTSIFGGETLSNIMDESGGFLGDETTWGAFERSQNTERSIDLNHVAMMEVLGNKSSSLGKKHSTSSRRPLTVSHFEPLQETEEEPSVDMNGLIQKMNGAHERSMDQALRDEPVPENMQISQDFSTTFELSRMMSLNLAPLPTHQESRSESIPHGHPNPTTLPNITTPTKKTHPKGSTSHPPLTPTSALARLNLVQQPKKDIPASPSKSPKKKASTTPSCTPVDENKKPAILECVNEPRSNLITPQLSSKPMVSKRISLSIPPSEVKKRDFGSRINGGASRRASEVPPPTSAPPMITKMSVPKRARPSSTIITTHRDLDSSLMPPPPPPLKKRVSLLPPGKTSGLGIGLPSSSSSSSSSYATTRMKPKPSTAIVPRGSPKVMKPRSSISSSTILNGSPSHKVLQHRPSIPSTLSRPRSSITTTNPNPKMNGMVKEFNQVKLDSTRPMMMKKPLSSSSISSSISKELNPSKRVIMRPSISSTDLNSLQKPNSMMIKPSSSSNELNLYKTKTVSSIRSFNSTNELNKTKSNGIRTLKSNEVNEPIKVEDLKLKSFHTLHHHHHGSIQKSSEEVEKSDLKLKRVSLNEFGMIKSGIPSMRSKSKLDRLN
ncbi:hypothetical protein DFH28DRAFT_1029982 [Melampsora americana]|nr:hypothetical protein DFH28DRAFT_1029982 [Melampsora americana]